MPHSPLEEDINKFLKSNLARQPEYVRAYIDVVSKRLTIASTVDDTAELEDLRQLLAELRKTLSASAPSIPG